jgi:MarR family 2-MHQ and catechol resistance regulon transcriptional repressor
MTSGAPVPPISPEDALQHPDLTTTGLFVEASAGLLGTLGNRLETETGLSVQWFEVLLRLVRTPGHRLRMTDLAAQTTLSASGLTRAVDRMASAGLVRREPCESDRRGSYAVLTDDGRARIEAAVPLHVEQLQEIYRRTFTPAELATFSQLLRRLRDEINPEAAAASGPRLTPVDLDA